MELRLGARVLVRIMVRVRVLVRWRFVVLASVGSVGLELLDRHARQALVPVGHRIVVHRDTFRCTEGEADGLIPGACDSARIAARIAAGLQRPFQLVPSPTLSPTDPVPRGLLTLWARAGMCVCMYVFLHSPTLHPSVSSLFLAFSRLVDSSLSSVVSGREGVRRRARGGRTKVRGFR